MFRAPPPSPDARGCIAGTASARCRRARRGQRPRANAEVFCTGTGRSHGWPGERTGSVLRIPREQVNNERQWEVGQANSTWEASEQRGGCARFRGGGGGKEPGQGEDATVSQGPDAEPESPARGTGADTAG